MSRQWLAVKQTKDTQYLRIQAAKKDADKVFKVGGRSKGKSNTIKSSKILQSI